MFPEIDYDKVDALGPLLPQDAEPPTVQKFDINALPIIDLAVSSPRPLEETYRLADDVIKDRLSTVTGVASVNLIGGREREILVAVDRDRLKAYGLSIMQVVGAVRAANLNIPGGRITEARNEFSVRLSGEFDNVAQIRQMELPGRNGVAIHLTDVAQVIDTFEEQRTLARLNRNPCIGVSIVKRDDANTVQTANEVKKALARLREDLPQDIKIDIVRDRSVFVQASIDDVMTNLLLGVVLTALVLFLFLHSWRGTVVVAIAMPTSIIATFNLIRFAGFTLNFMSLMGLAISVGILVSSSIVVLENIYRHHEKAGDDPKLASDRGTSEVAVAVIASMMTNLVVFTPIAFMKGIVGQFFMQFGLTVVFASIFSLLVSFTLTPMLAAKLLVKERGDRKGLLTKFWQRWDRFYEELESDYKRTLEWAIHHKTLLAVGVTALLFGSIVLVRFVGSEFITPADEGMITITVEMPAGSNLRSTDRALRRIENILSRFEEIERTYTVLGKLEGTLGTGAEGVDVGELTIKLVDKNRRDHSTREIVDAMRPLLAEVPAAKISVKPTNPFGGGGQADVQIEITGREMTTLNRVAQQVMAIARQVPGVVDVNSTWKLGKPEVKITPDRRRLTNYGLTVAQVATALRTSLEGQVASKYRVGDDEYDIRVRFADADKENVAQVRDVAVQAGRFSVPLSELGNIAPGEGPTQIMRKNKERLVTVTANIAQGTLGEVQAAIQEKLAEVSLPSGYHVYFGGQSERQAESFASILQALLLAIVLTYMVLAAILESYIHPITIMVTLPLGLIGVILSLLITNTTLSIFSMMAMVMLVGIVVNNAILLIDYIKVLRGEGMSLDEAIITACPVRMRPIIMINLATALGMLPLALGLGKGAETRAPMAIVSIGALITSTVFTLYVIS